MLHLLRAQINYFQWRRLASALKTETTPSRCAFVVMHIRCKVPVFSGAPVAHRDGKIATFFECSKCTVGHVTRTNQSALQDLLLVERSVKLKIKDQLTPGHPGLYDLSSSYYFDTNRRKNARRYISSDLGITGEHDDSCFYIMLHYVHWYNRFWLLSNSRRDSTAASQVPWIKNECGTASVFHKFLDATSERPLRLL